MEDVDRFAEILLSPEDIPPMDIYETACYFAFEAELYKHIIPAQFNLKYVMALRGNLARILQGKEVEGLSPNKPQNAPPLPNFTAAFEIALPQQIYARIIACEHEYKNTFGTFSRNLRRVYGRVGGWCQPYYGHHPKEKYPPRKDWGKELLIKQTELAILTTHCKDKLRLLIETLGIYGGICGSYGATNLFFKPQQLKLNPLPNKSAEGAIQLKRNAMKKQ